MTRPDLRLVGVYTGPRLLRGQRRRQKLERLPQPSERPPNNWPTVVVVLVAGILLGVAIGLGVARWLP